MRPNNNCFGHSANARRRRESGPEHLRQKTFIRISATGLSVRALPAAGGFFRENRARMLQATQPKSSRLNAQRPA